MSSDLKFPEIRKNVNFVVNYENVKKFKQMAYERIYKKQNYADVRIKSHIEIFDFLAEVSINLCRNTETSLVVLKALNDFSTGLLFQRRNKSQEKTTTVEKSKEFRKYNNKVKKNIIEFVALLEEKSCDPLLPTAQLIHFSKNYLNRIDFLFDDAQKIVDGQNFVDIVDVLYKKIQDFNTVEKVLLSLYSDLVESPQAISDVNGDIFLTAVELDLPPIKKKTLQNILMKYRKEHRLVAKMRGRPKKISR